MSEGAASGGRGTALFGANPLPMWLFDARASRVLDVNDAALTRYALDRVEALALDPSSLAGADAAERFRAWLQAAEEGPTAAFDQAPPGGLSFPAELRVSRLDWDGEEARLLVVRDVGTRQRVEERLRQAQKMEAVGRLSGSIAHDFNNLLTAIGGYADLLLASLDPGDPRSDDVREVKRAVERGAALTQQLLAFSRRQIVTPQVVDLNEVVRGMRPLLDRLLGERTQLVLGLGRRAGHVTADPGQLEQVILNLALNARDAMPRGGRLLIETAHVELDEPYAATRGDVEPGPFAMLAVSDEGHGLTDEARAHLFEPFFTTKPRGEGTGLGLATVYGIVRQAGGHIDVFSEPDFGTTFRVYLPSVHRARRQQREAPRPTAPAAAARRVEGRVLVAEDDPVVRRIVAQTLERSGLVVEQAADGVEALDRLARGPLPDLLVADVRMPRLGGPELAAAAVARWPRLRVMFVSGHTGSDTADHLIARGWRVLGKPFTAAQLIDAVATAIGPAPGGGAADDGDR